MNILLLGNGFDLYHHLPTSYLCFLSVAKHLKEGKSAKSIKEVFESTKNVCKQINVSYDTYKSFYETYIFDEDDKKDIEEIRDIVKTNLWIKYFINAFNKDVGWIDFEKEIALVLNYFSDFFNTTYLYDRDKNDVKCHYKYYSYIITQFDFFFTITNNKWLYVKDDFSLQTPHGSDLYSIDKEKIYSYLSDELSRVAKALKLYLKVFIDNPLRKMKEANHVHINNLFNSIDYLVSYNYTFTYEILYNCKSISHIHGNTNSEIVLGINSNEQDEIAALDTSHIMFKKYYQRILLGTDTQYYFEITNRAEEEGLYYSDDKYPLL